MPRVCVGGGGGGRFRMLCRVQDAQSLPRSRPAAFVLEVWGEVACDQPQRPLTIVRQVLAIAANQTKKEAMTIKEGDERSV